MKMLKFFSKTFFFTFLAYLALFTFSCRNSDIIKKVVIPPNYSEILSFRGIVLYGGNGLSITEPIIIKGASSTFYGIEAEAQYLEKFYPGYVLSNQYLIESKDGSKILDCIEIFLPGGEKKKIFFDITEFYQRK